MRIAFSKTLETCAANDKRIMLLTGDLGFSVFEPFQKSFPQQYINCGLTEQALTGIAAGLAMEGRIPVIYSIAPFVTMRNFEQIRNDICYQNLNVKIVGVGAGFSYGPYAHTHHALEDIGILRILPNLTILCPGDPVEAELATRAMLKLVGPVYMRLGRAGEPIVYTNVPEFTVGSAITVKTGNAGAIIATSTMLRRAVDVSESLKKSRGVSVAVISMPTIKPLDEKIILRLAGKMPFIVTLEEHFITGGLGSAVAEVLAEGNVHIKFKRIGVPDRFPKAIGRQEIMRAESGLSEAQVVRVILDLINLR